jgi:hypothetical protein
VCVIPKNFYTKQDIFITLRTSNVPLDVTSSYNFIVTCHQQHKYGSRANFEVGVIKIPRNTGRLNFLCKLVFK